MARLFLFLAERWKAIVIDAPGVRIRVMGVALLKQAPGLIRLEHGNAELETTVFVHIAVENSIAETFCRRSKMTWKVRIAIIIIIVLICNSGGIADVRIGYRWRRHLLTEDRGSRSRTGADPGKSANRGGSNPLHIPHPYIPLRIEK